MRSLVPSHLIRARGSDWPVICRRRVSCKRRPHDGLSWSTRGFLGCAAWSTFPLRVEGPFLPPSGLETTPRRPRSSSHCYLRPPGGLERHFGDNAPTGGTTVYQEPTVYALSTAPGRAAIAVVRISGSACLNVYRRICPGRPDPKPRIATIRTLYEPGTVAEGASSSSPKSVLDSTALVLYFPSPYTATGEDILELHVHGGPAIVKAVLAAISQCGEQPHAIRYAEPGEFTRRAFMNGRLDLTQVEALGDALSAETEQQRRQSVRGATGALAKHYENWRQRLLYARGELEALIDFSEDQHFDESPGELCASVAAQVRSLRRALRIHSQNTVRGELLRQGISISLLGAPNAGKSSLLNRIVGREAAIVSNEAGTTRDVVEIGLDVGGYFCRFGDTAGLRQVGESSLTSSSSLSKQEGRQDLGDSRVLQLNGENGRCPAAAVAARINEIEAEGMRRAKERAANSDLVIVVLSLELVEVEGQEKNDGLNNSTRCAAEVHLDEEVCTFAERLIQEKDNVVIVINKADLLLSASDAATAAGAIRRQVLDRFPALGNRYSNRQQQREEEEDEEAAQTVHMVSCIGKVAAEKAVNHNETRRSGPGPSGTNSMHMVQMQSSNNNTGSNSNSNSNDNNDDHLDSDGIESFLTQGLIRHIRKLTAAVTPTGTNSKTNVDEEEDDLSIWQESLGASERHRRLLDACISHLDAFLTEAVPSVTQRRDDVAPVRAVAETDQMAKEDGTSLVEEDEVGERETDIVVAAEHLRAAAECLAKITGKGEAGDVEQVLGVVFEKFCVGK